MFDSQQERKKVKGMKIKTQTKELDENYGEKLNKMKRNTLSI
jgi:hypothetical protein